MRWSFFKPELGLEPRTCSLRVSCSATELFWPALSSLRTEKYHITDFTGNQPVSLGSLRQQNFVKSLLDREIIAGKVHS